MKRPVSITVISWILIFIGSVSVVTSLYSLTLPMAQELMRRSIIPLPAQIVLLFLGLAMTVTSGIFMLKGMNWARLLYAIWSGVGFIISLCTSPIKMALVPGFCFYVIICIFLFLPSANRYFRGASASRL